MDEDEGNENLRVNPLPGEGEVDAKQVTHSNHLNHIRFGL